MSTGTLYRIVNTLMLGLALILIARPASAQDPAADIREVMESRDTEIKRLLGPAGQEVPEETRRALREVINEIIDFESMAQAALGATWSTLSAEDQVRFVEVFGDIIRGQSLSNLDPYRSSVSYEDIAVDGPTAHVVTRTVYKDIPMVVEYNMASSDNGWRVTDIILDDVSTVDGYARSFRSMIRRRGFDTLMERLEKRREQMTD
jgi:phospholipid transport system substrate-binding protein